MDIRTRLVFVLVTVALGGMLALGSIMFADASRLLDAVTREQVEGMAEARRDALQEIIVAWHERVRLVASRRQLREGVRAYRESGDSTELRRIRRILADAAASQQTVAALTVLTPEGRPLVSSSHRPPPLDEDDLHTVAQAPERVRFRGVRFADSEPPRVDLVTGLLLDDELLGFLLAELTTADVVRLTRDYAGLGESGEVLVVARGDDGSARVLHPVRHGDGDADVRVDATGSDAPTARALAGEERFFADGMTDYRGSAVWAATRHVPETGWGLVVKFDAAEKTAPIDEFRDQMTNLALSLAAFAILIGAVLGVRLAKPIQDLAGVANRIRGGELNARADEGRQDEMGVLARTFNQMADELEERLTQLKEYHTFFEVSPDLLCIAGTDGYFKDTNPAFERTLGWTREELLSKPFIDFVHPDDVDATVREVEKLSQGITTISFENRYRCADGTYKVLRWATYPDPETGKLYAVAHEMRPTETAS